MLPPTGAKVIKATPAAATTAATLLPLHVTTGSPEAHNGWLTRVTAAIEALPRPASPKGSPNVQKDEKMLTVTAISSIKATDALA